MFDRTPAKYLVQKNLTGRFGVRKGVKAVETRGGWVAVSEETVYVSLCDWSEWSDHEVPRPAREWQTLVNQAKLVAYDSGERHTVYLPAGTRYLLRRAGNPASAALLFLIRPDREYGPEAARSSLRKHGYNYTS